MTNERDLDRNAFSREGPRRLDPVGDATTTSLELPIPDSPAAAIGVVLFVALLIALWFVVRRGRNRSADHYRERRRGAGEAPPEPEDPRELP